MVLSRFAVHSLWCTRPHAHSGSLPFAFDQPRARLVPLVTSGGCLCLVVALARHIRGCSAVQEGPVFVWSPASSQTAVCIRFLYGDRLSDVVYRCHEVSPASRLVLPYAMSQEVLTA
jgi:hypothetical protein